MPAKPVVVCPQCGQHGDNPPGFRLEDYPHLQAVIIEEAALVGPNLPQRLVCRNCGHAEPVARGSIEVRKP